MSSEKKLAAPGSRSTPLLPNLSHTRKLLGLTTSLTQMLEQMCSSLEIDLPLSRATKYKFNDLARLQQVGQKSRDKVTVFLQQAILATNSPDLPLPSVQEYTGGASETGWIGVARVLNQSRSDQRQLKYLINFIESRIELERNLLNQISLSNSPQNIVSDNYIALLQSQTLIPESSLRCAHLILNEQRHSCSEEDVALWLCYSRLDFYFSAIALLELGWLDFLRQISPEMLERKPSWFEHGIMSSFIQPLVIEGDKVELKDSFELFLKWLAEDIGTSPSKSRITLYEMASYIPIESSDETANGYDLEEKRRDLLKDWRKGKLPSYSKFRGFIKNLRSARQSMVEVDLLTDIGVAVMAIDRLFLEIFEDLQHFQSVQCFQAFSRSIERYPEYYRHFQSSYSKKQGA
ncbi:hypothetical protein [Aliidiomarina indica]|uniref:hypothetical protein n=1 Tax=Aliidiomarina indica TaxID=2749147 RepID=UPI00188FE097|nr:hypothetical protein [Aliidiomarina indica]